MNEIRLGQYVAAAERTVLAYGKELADKQGELDAHALEILAVVALNVIKNDAGQERIGEALVRVMTAVLGPEHVTLLGPTTETPQ